MITNFKTVHHFFVARINSMHQKKNAKQKDGKFEA